MHASECTLQTTKDHHELIDAAYRSANYRKIGSISIRKDLCMGRSSSYFKILSAHWPFVLWEGGGGGGGGVCGVLWCESV